MSRIGKKVISVQGGIEVVVANGKINVKGPRGELTMNLPVGVMVDITSGLIAVKPLSESKQDRSSWGTCRAKIANMINGVTNGYEKKLEIEGVGYRASVEGGELTLIMGFTNPVKVNAPEGVSFAVQKNVIIVSGIDKEAVTLTAAKIKAVKPPEPYKGKGIRYQGEKIRRKVGKKAASSGSK
ncbi:MAG: 50S ribosomal protein L6 [bacterium]